jgi:hypothetical protein
VEFWLSRCLYLVKLVTYTKQKFKNPIMGLWGDEYVLENNVENKKKLNLQR